MVKNSFSLEGREVNYYSFNVPAGLDGKLWKVNQSAGPIRLLTVPPYFARSAAELLLPAEVVAADGQSVEEVDDPDPQRFAKSIAAFGDQDKASMPKPGGVVFVGSSSVRLLEIAKYFPQLQNAVNRGFGGAHIF